MTGLADKSSCFHAVDLGPLGSCELLGGHTSEKGKPSLGLLEKELRSSLVEQKQRSFLVGKGKQALRALGECLQGSSTLAAALILPELYIWGLVWGLVLFGIFLSEFE